MCSETEARDKQLLLEQTMTKEEPSAIVSLSPPDKARSSKVKSRPKHRRSPYPPVSSYIVADCASDVTDGSGRLSEDAQTSVAVALSPYKNKDYATQHAYYSDTASRYGPYYDPTYGYSSMYSAEAALRMYSQVLREHQPLQSDSHLMSRRQYDTNRQSAAGYVNCPVTDLSAFGNIFSSCNLLNIYDSYGMNRNKTSSSSSYCSSEPNSGASHATQAAYPSNQQQDEKPPFNSCMLFSNRQVRASGIGTVNSISPSHLTVDVANCSGARSTLTYDYDSNRSSCMQDSAAAGDTNGVNKNNYANQAVTPMQQTLDNTNSVTDECVPSNAKDIQLSRANTTLQPVTYSSHQQPSVIVRAQSQATDTITSTSDPLKRLEDMNMRAKTDDKYSGYKSGLLYSGQPETPMFDFHKSFSTVYATDNHYNYGTRPFQQGYQGVIVEAQHYQPLNGLSLV